MLTLDRQYQKHLLIQLANLYPSAAECFYPEEDGEEHRIAVNCAYLKEHGLIDYETYQTLDDPNPSPEQIRITASGLDFISDDGGLSAILGIITVKFDEGTIRTLIEARIMSEDTDPSIKESLLKEVRSLPSAALRAISERAIARGLAATPAGLMALRQILGL